MPAVAMLQTEWIHRRFPSPRVALGDANRLQPVCATRIAQDPSLAADLDAETMQQVDKLVAIRVRVRKGQTLFRNGGDFTSLYWLRSGSFKTMSLSAGGHERVVGYHIPGDIIGADGIGSGTHSWRAMAIEDSEVCALPFEGIEALCRQNCNLQRNLYRLLSRETARADAVIVLLTTMHAERRLGAYLLDLAQRYQERGYSSCELVLRMTRAEIGSYLGLTLETVCRSLSHLHRDGLVWVQRREVKLLDRSSLQRFVNAGHVRKGDFGPGAIPAREMSP